MINLTKTLYVALFSVILLSCSTQNQSKTDSLESELSDVKKELNQIKYGAKVSTGSGDSLYLHPGQIYAKVKYHSTDNLELFDKQFVNFEEVGTGKMLTFSETFNEFTFIPDLKNRFYVNLKIVNGMGSNDKQKEIKKDVEYKLVYSSKIDNNMARVNCRCDYEIHGLQIVDIAKMDGLFLDQVMSQ